MSAAPRAMPRRRGRLILRRVFDDAARTSAAAPGPRLTALTADEARVVPACAIDWPLAAEARGASVLWDGERIAAPKPRQLPGVLSLPRYQRGAISDKILCFKQDRSRPLAEALAACPPLMTTPPLMTQWPTIGPI
jgi:hypothetical protein